VGAPLAYHDKEKGRHEQMIRSFIDEDNVMAIAQFAAQLRRGNHPAAAAAEYNDLLSPVESEHA
jgi:hypothetical protein